MSRKYNTKHPERGRSNYGKRLAARGLSMAPALLKLEPLRERQLRCEERTGVPWPTAADSPLGLSAEGDEDSEALLSAIFEGEAVNS
jgi:hypothetical protein